MWARVAVLLCWQGARRVMDKALEDAARRQGLWRLNAGLLLAAASMIGFTYLGR